MTSVYAFATKLQTISAADKAEKDRIASTRDKSDMDEIIYQYAKDTNGMDRNSPLVLQLEERKERLQEMQTACKQRLAEIEQRSESIKELSQACDKN